MFSEFQTAVKGLTNKPAQQHIFHHSDKGLISYRTSISCKTVPENEDATSDNARVADRRLIRFEVHATTSKAYTPITLSPRAKLALHRAQSIDQTETAPADAAGVTPTVVNTFRHVLPAAKWVVHRQSRRSGLFLYASRRGECGR